MKTKIYDTHIRYDWNKIQLDYNSGLSQNDISNKYGVSRASIYRAIKRGVFQSRPLQIACGIWANQNPEFWNRDANHPIEKIEEKRYLKLLLRENMVGI